VRGTMVSIISRKTLCATTTSKSHLQPRALAQEYRKKPLNSSASSYTLVQGARFKLGLWCGRPLDIQCGVVLNATKFARPNVCRVRGDRPCPCIRARSGTFAVVALRALPVSPAPRTWLAIYKRHMKTVATNIDHRLSILESLHTFLHVQKFFQDGD
jgi:hypothetical protein